MLFLVQIVGCLLEIFRITQVGVVGLGPLHSRPRVKSLNLEFSRVQYSKLKTFHSKLKLLRASSSSTFQWCEQVESGHAQSEMSRGNGTKQRSIYDKPKNARKPIGLGPTKCELELWKFLSYSVDVAGDFDTDLVKNDQELVVVVPHGIHQGAI